MKVTIYSVDGSEVGEADLPAVFQTPVREDLIRRAVISAQSARYQPYAPSSVAGKQTSAESVGKGRGIARVRRTSGGRRTGAFVPQAVGGHRAHPPKVEKQVHKKINDKERGLAIRSAIAATSSAELVKARGHVIDDKPLPMVVSDEFYEISKASDIRTALTKMGLGGELGRISHGRTQRAGRGKMRGRRLRTRKGPVFVLGGVTPVEKALSNFPGVDAARSDGLNAEVLAPGGVPGRLSVWTASALKRMDDIYAR
jgi:large subunit ribosomal protein L4e